MPLSLNSRAEPSDQALFQDVCGEVVLLNLATERYFGLDPVGSRIWLLLREDPAISRAFERLLDEFDVEPGRLERDILDLVARLADAGLVEIA